MDKEIIYIALGVWIFTYILYSTINSNCMKEKELYFYMSPKYIKYKLGFENLMTVCLSIINFIIAPFYYISLLIMMGLRYIVDTIIWTKKSKELEEKIERMERQQKANKNNKGRINPKKIKRLGKWINLLKEL